MKRLILIAAGGLMLTSAAPAPLGSTDGAKSYPPCTAGKTDRCTQTNERSRPVSTAARGESELDSVVAAGAPRVRADGPVPVPTAEPMRRTAARGSYPRCSATVTDRCVQGGSAVASRRTGETRRVQLAMRAGERG
jgi:hypothetical protein